MDFNQSTRHETDDTPTTNHAGGGAFDPADPRTKLRSVVTANLIEDNYYREDTDALADVRSAFEACAAAGHTEYVLQLAAYAREELYQRDVAQVLLVLAANDSRFHGRYDPENADSPSLIRAYAPSIIQRADEPATCVAIHNQLFATGESQHPATTLPKPLKDALSDALGRFDDYQLAKYSQSNREVSLVDVFNMVHPDPAAAELFGGERATQAERYERLTKGGLDTHPDVEPLPTPETWESVLSNHEGPKAEAWRSVLPRMGLFATIRNLRNMREEGLTGVEIFNPSGGVNDNPPTMTDVRRSKVYPFRFYQAWKALKGAQPGPRAYGVSAPRDLLDDVTAAWLEDAMTAAVANLPEVFQNSRTLVAVDASGSMDHALSENSSLTQKELAAFLGAILSRAGDGVTVGVFGDDYAYVPLHQADSVPNATDDILRHGESVGNSTNGWKALDVAAGLPSRSDGTVSRGEVSVYDRVIIVTDCQIWDSTGGFLGRDHRTVADAYADYAGILQSDGHPQPPLYMLDVASYGHLSAPSDMDGVYHIGGWSETVLDYIGLAETDVEATIGEMEPRGITARGQPVRGRGGGDE